MLHFVRLKNSNQGKEGNALKVAIVVISCLTSFCNPPPPPPCPVLSLRPFSPDSNLVDVTALRL